MEAHVQERLAVLASRSFATELASEAERLNVLDDLWTAYLADPSNEAELQSNLPTLQALVGQMMVLLSDISLKSRELRQLIIEFPSDLDRELEVLLAEHPAAADLREALPPEPFAKSVGEACEAVERETPRAMHELAEKLDRIAAGEFQPGDLRIDLKCAVALVGAGAGLIATIAGPGALITLPTAVLIGSGVVGSVASLLTAYKGWGCRQRREAAPAPA